MPTRQEVYEAIDSEREYQGYWDKLRKDNPELRSLLDKDKSIETWILWMEEYLNLARTAATKSLDKSGSLNNIRKVVSLGVACMEYLGAPKRPKIEHDEINTA